MTRRVIPPVADIAALAAIVWVAAATLHEGLGHGLACQAMGGIPAGWSTFHFDCASQAMAIGGRRIVAGAGTAINLVLMVIAWLWWRRDPRPAAKLAGWTMFVVNGLTSFGYLVFSAAFGIGDWNGAGVMAEVADPAMARGLLAVVGVAGYYAIVRGAARMLAAVVRGPAAVRETRRLTVTIWMTTGIVSLFAALAAGADWRSTLGASIGVALGGNAGLLSIARFVVPSTDASPVIALPKVWRGVAIMAVAAFVLVLGPGVRL
jgi:hypothetical protein